MIESCKIVKPCDIKLKIVNWYNRYDIKWVKSEVICTDKKYIAEEFRIGSAEIVICTDKCAGTKKEIEEILEKTAKNVKPYLVKKAGKEREENAGTI